MILPLLVSALLQPLPPQVARLAVRADRLEIQPGEIVQIDWAASGVTEVWLEPPGQAMQPTGSMVVRPTVTTTYWFSAVNVAGGESRPLTITVAGTIPAEPEPPIPAAPAPVRLPQAPPAVSSLASPAASPSVLDQAWIQVVALSNRGQAERLVEELSAKCGERPVIQEVADPGGSARIIHRVRFGPFPSVKEAKAHLRGLEPHLKGIGSKPFVTVR